MALRLLGSCLCVVLFGCWPSVLWAAEAPLLRGMQDRIFQQQEERQRALEQQMRPAPPPHGEELPLLELTPAQPDAACADIREIIIVGATLLRDMFLDPLKADYEGRCLTLDDINNITKRLTNEYVRQGYVTSRAFLGPQDLATGVLATGVLYVTIVEGRIEHIVPAPSSGIDPRQLMAVFPGLKGKILNLRDIEQGLDQINRLPSNNATMNIEPGREFGSSVVVIDNEPQKSWRASAGVDNYGQRETGRHQYTLTFEKDNFIGSFDQFMFTYNSDLHSVFRGVNSRASGNNHGLGIYETLVLGWWTLSLSYNNYKYDSKVHGLASEYSSKGSSNTWRFGLDRVLHRDAAGKTSAGVLLNVHDVNNYFEGVYLDASSYFLTSLAFSLSHSRRIMGGSLSARLEQRFGVPLFGAERDKNPEHSTPRREYSKTSFSLNWYRPFALGDQNFAWSCAFSGQLSPDTLYGSERFYLGSIYTVRGFEDSPLGGDEGVLLRNELAWTVPPDWLFALTKLLGPVQAYAAYDVGHIRRDREDPFERGTLEGVAVGLRSLGDLSFDLTFSKAVSAPSFVQKKQDILSASVRYTF